MRIATKLALLLILFGAASGLYAQSESKKKEIVQDSNEAKKEFIKADKEMGGLFSKAYGYTIFPNVGKGGLGVGAAAGNGAVYQGGKLVGTASLKQLSIGLQAGGQAYREVVFFQTKEAMDRF